MLNILYSPKQELLAVGMARNSRLWLFGNVSYEFDVFSMLNRLSEIKVNRIDIGVRLNIIKSHRSSVGLYPVIVKFD